MQVQWSHSVLRVRDVDMMVDFYCDAFGFEVADRGHVGADTEIVFLSGSSSDHHQLGLMSGRADDDAGGSLDHMAFRVASVDQVKEMIAWVEADSRVGSGAPVTHGNAVSVYFSDPEGNGIEIFADTPWHVEQPIVRGWNPEKPTEEVLAGIEEKFKDSPGFMDMERYRSERAAAFGEV